MSLQRIIPHAFITTADEVVKAQVGVTMPNLDDPREVTMRSFICDMIKQQGDNLAVKSEFSKVRAPTSLYLKDEDGNPTKEVPVVSILTFYWWTKKS